MTAFDEHLKKVSSFLDEFESLIDSHLVDFITEDLWSKCLPEALRLELETLGADFSSQNYRSESLELNKFLEEADLLSLNKCDLVYEAKDLPNLFSSWGLEPDDPENDEKSKRNGFMKEKKSHEVEILARVTAVLTKSHNGMVVDAGAGKGYLSEFVSTRYGIPVLAIDSSEVNHRGAIKRRDLMRNKTSQRPDLVRHVVQRIDDATDFSGLAETHFPGHSMSRDVTITGLHTCGSLGHSVIKAFLQTDCIKSLCLVTCCYHLAETSMSGRLKFTKNAKMLAQQSVERTRESEQCLSPTLHYRAVLQVLLHSLGLYDVRIGRGAPSGDFVTYARWALRKCGLNESQIPEDDILRELYSSYKSYESKMKHFQMLRICLGSVVESAILLDRIIHLEESKVCSNFALVRLFDPVISPRCYGIIAIK